MTTNTPAKQIYDIYNLGIEAEDIKEALEISIDYEKGNNALYEQIVDLKGQIDDSVATYSYNAETKTLSLSAEENGDIEINDYVIYF